MRMRPTVGITSWHHQDEEERWEFVQETYTQAVREAGGLPVILPIAGKHPDLVPDYLQNLDGLLLTGGADIHPSFYGEVVLERCGPIDEDRDLFEVEMVRGARERNLPLLGICRGLQVINVALGGTLYQDLTYRPGTTVDHDAPKEKRFEAIHPIRVHPGSRLAAILSPGEHPVTSSHHQIIRDLAPGLAVNAVAEDGVIEGIEDPQAPFLLAVQWHPERMAPRMPQQRALFETFIEATRHRSRGKKIKTRRTR